MYIAVYSLTSIQNAVPIRGDPHILIVGDPGLGKSQVSTHIYSQTYQHAYVYAFSYVSTYEVVLNRLPYFSHVPMSNYFTFQITDISIQYRLLQTYNKSYKIVSKLANLLQLLGSIMSRMYNNYLMLISRYCSFRIYRYRLSQNSSIICCFQLPIR